MSGVDWVQRLRYGSRVLFWTVLISVLLANLLGFAVALFAGTNAPIKWLALITAVESNINIGIFRMIILRNCVYG